MERTKYLSEQEVKELRLNAENKAMKDAKHKRVGGVLSWMLVDSALSTGLRVGELAAIRIEHIDFKRNLLYVYSLKRKKPVKDIVPISPEFKEHLKEYIGKRRKGKLFVGKRGNLSRQGLQQIWKAAIRRAELPKEYSIHSARHTMAVHLLRKTKNLRQVQKQLRHKSIEVTANMYADVPWDDMLDGVTGLYS